MTTPIPEYSIVIPARYASTRFPGKPLAPLAGRPLLLHVVDRARESGARDYRVATDDSRIEALCVAEGVPVVLTSPDHPSGTDRLAEVAAALGWPDDRLVVGLQGDEPATPPDVLDALAGALAESRAADMATVATPIASAEEFRNANRVKVVCADDGRALYFSRAAIPHRRDARDESVPSEARLHVGLYAYRAGFLKRYASLTPSPLEAIEQLEQLRALHHGYGIRVLTVESMQAHGVDHPDDIPAVEAVLRERFDAAGEAGTVIERVTLVSDRPFFRRLVESNLRRLRPLVPLETLSSADARSIAVRGSVDSAALNLCLYDLASIDVANATASSAVDVELGARSWVVHTERVLGARAAFVLDEQDDEITDALLAAGAIGVLVKAVPPGVFSTSLDALLQGERVRPTPAIDLPADVLPVEIRQQLSARRQKLLRLLLGGTSLSKIAERLQMTQDKVVTETRLVMNLLRGRR